MTKIKQADHKELASRIGLDKCRLATIAGKACQKEILDFFRALDIPLIQLYAMSEAGWESFQKGNYCFLQYCIVSYLLIIIYFKYCNCFLEELNS